MPARDDAATAAATAVVVASTRAALRIAPKPQADGFAKGLELILTPCAVAAIGYGIDRWVGTTPIFLVLFAVLGVVGTGLRSWYAYDAEMKRAEAELAEVHGGDQSTLGRTSTSLPTPDTLRSRRQRRAA